MGLQNTESKKLKVSTQYFFATVTLEVLQHAVWEILRKTGRKLRKLT